MPMANARLCIIYTHQPSTHRVSRSKLRNYLPNSVPLFRKNVHSQICLKSHPTQWRLLRLRWWQRLMKFRVTRKNVGILWRATVYAVDRRLSVIAISITAVDVIISGLLPFGGTISPFLAKPCVLSLGFLSSSRHTFFRELTWLARCKHFFRGRTDSTRTSTSSFSQDRRLRFPP